MLTPASLFRVLTEFIFILLGGFLASVELSHRFLFDPRRPGWLLLGGVLVYWGARAFAKTARAARTADRTATQIGGASLAVVGLMMLGLAFVEFRWVGVILASAGVILALRGLLGAVLALRTH
jgi:hypothetical protein